MKARFLLSTLTEFPVLKDPRGALLPEIALVGRSNVGKSSLINHLLNQKKLARISATPGKTQLLNFFVVDEKFLLVDLPGYGFAKAPPEEIEKWSKAIDAYINQRSTLKLLLLLIDSRRDIAAEDQKMIDWANHKQVPLLLIFTKTDKLTSAELNKLLKKYEGALGYSVSNSSSRYLVEKRIEKALWG
ncbi:MAG: YihA family ribosome biogenesis GTP-binding protein [Chlamydiae bacterium CG10_big_fil_rev_8_21_14_0_10_42_34]|nr:MAG: YihA family ribosome biogenesis GTP-binding protein [Chlamydiae bacterium CG10_big_fil_rev_8_21_14_0_10_42_34]